MGMIRRGRDDGGRDQRKQEDGEEETLNPRHVDRSGFQGAVRVRGRGRGSGEYRVDLDWGSGGRISGTQELLFILPSGMCIS